MGEVYLAQDTKLERQVALKVLPADVAGDPDRLARLQREAKALAALDHPGIVTVFSVEEADGIHFLTMAYVEGRTLGELIPPEGMAVGRLLELGVALADALRAAHERGIVHRDMKPSNVMVDADGRLRVLDFGLARLEEAVPMSSQLPTRPIDELMTRQGVVLGTIPYMSPEQAEGKRLDASSDLFSLGVVLYEMATGTRPFVGETPASLISSILRDTPSAVTEMRPELPEPLGRVVSRCLEKAPERRFPSAMALRDELEAMRREVLSGKVPPAMTARPPRSRTRTLTLAAVAVALTAVVGTSVWRSGERPSGEDQEAVVEPAAPQIRSIAVLPLRNLSGDPEQEYLVDGMTEALITDLSKIASLKVIARSSSMRYKGTETPLTEIAAALGVDGIIEGSVIREGEQVGITAQLIEVVSEQVIWGEQYTRELASILALQAEVATAIAEGIELTLSPEERSLISRSREVDPAAYEAYLKGMFHWHRFTEDDLDSAKRYFELALEKDPGYALAYVGLADAIATRAHTGHEPPAEPFRQAKAALERALELDPDLAEAHDLRARIAFSWDWDWEGAGRGFRRAIELNPNLPDVHVVYSQFLGITGRPDDALAEAERALELDPLSAFVRQQVSTRLWWMGRYDEAIAGLEALLESGGDLPFVRHLYWDVLFSKGQYDKALAEARRYYELEGEEELLESLARGYEANGYRGAMGALAEKMEELSPQAYVSAVELARIHVHAGQVDQALKWLEKASRDHESVLVYVTVNPIFESLHGDPRFEAIRARVHLPPTEGITDSASTRK